MKTTMYISDLDGTLLNPNKQITPKTANLLNAALNEGIHFSVATARTPATVVPMLENIQIKEPIIVMNGVALYNLSRHCYEEVEFVPQEVAVQVFKCLAEDVQHTFIYTIEADQLTVYYDQLVGRGRINFYEERKNLKYKHFVRGSVKHLDSIIYWVFIDQKERVQALANRLEEVDGIGKVMYKDIYDADAYILEVYSHKVSKANAILKLKSRVGFDRMVCFGDHLNDLSMFQLADEAYAVGNAVEEVKQLATGVIGSNTEDSVAKFIETHSRGK